MLCLSLICGMGTVCHDVFALLLGVTGRLCFVSLALPWTSHIHFYGDIESEA